MAVNILKHISSEKSAKRRTYPTTTKLVNITPIQRVLFRDFPNIIQPENKKKLLLFNFKLDLLL